LKKRRSLGWKSISDEQKFSVAVGKQLRDADPSFRRQADTITVEASPAPPKSVARTPLPIPYGNKEVAPPPQRRAGEAPEADGSLDPFSVNLRVLATFFVEIIK
jgi:hypothetical protein